MAKLPMNADILPAYEDYTFKSLMMRPESKPALMDLISACIGRTVTDVVIRNNELPVTDTEEKNERFDVNCVIDDGSQVNVEMQSSHIEEIGGGHNSFFGKYIYYLTDLHSSQKSKGIKYADLAKTYQITFCMYDVFPGHKDYITPINMRAADGRLIGDQINMIVVELNKLDDIIKKPVDDMTALDMWSIFLGNSDNPKHRELINKMIDRREALDMAGSVLTAISKDEHERAKFMSRRKFETDQMSNLLTAEERGRIAGREEGFEEGRAEERTSLVLRMKADGVPLETISRYTGLSVEEIERL